jgi:probable phosphomutase (TIGR03848 family)
MNPTGCCRHPRNNELVFAGLFWVNRHGKREGDRCLLAALIVAPAICYKTNAMLICGVIITEALAVTIEFKRNQMTRFLLIRHANTNAVGKFLSGRNSGVHLNEEGRTQAQDLALRLAGLPFAAVYSSPLERAVQTAEPIATTLQLQTILCDDFLELNFGEWTGKNIAELRDSRDFQLFNSFRSSTLIPGGESMAEAQARIIRGLQKLRAKHPGQTVAVVSHADLIKSALMFFAGMPLDLFQRIEISPASVSIVEVYEETARIQLLNGLGSINF